MKKWYSLLLFGLLSITQVTLPVTELVGEQLAQVPAVSEGSWKSGVYSAATTVAHFSGKLAKCLSKVGYCALWKAPCTVGSLLCSTSGRCQLGLGTLGLAALCGTGKAIYNRLYTINDVEYNVKGCISLVNTPKMYDWNRTVFPTADHLTALNAEQQKSFVEDFFGECKVGSFDIAVSPGKKLACEDVLGKLCEERQMLEKELRRLDPFVDISIRVFGRVYYLFGLTKNYQQTCFEMGITCNDNRTLNQRENELLQLAHEKCNDKWIAAYLLLHPNYSKAVQLSFDIKMLINRLNVLSSICERNKKLWGNGGNGNPPVQRHQHEHNYHH